MVPWEAYSSPAGLCRRQLEGLDMRLLLRKLFLEQLQMVVIEQQGLKTIILGSNVVFCFPTSMMLIGAEARKANNEHPDAPEPPEVYVI